MSPLKISYTIGGKEGTSITADDGVAGVLETPVGQVRGFVEKNDWFDRNLIYGSEKTAFVLFPGNSETVHINSTRAGGAKLVENIAQKLGIKMKPENRRIKRYKTLQGDIDIKVECW